MGDAVLTLWPVQERAIEAVRAELRRGHKRVLLVAPTGFGKTAVAAELIRRAVAKGHRVAFVVHRREIVRDTARRLADVDVRAAIVMAGEPAPTNEPVIVCSIQTLVARETCPPASLLIIDESHHSAAKTYREIAANYPSATHLGLTATPERADGVGLADAFDRLVVGATTAELVTLGLLAPCDVIAPPMRSQDLSEDPFIAWFRHAIGRRTIVFAESVNHAREITDAFAANGVAAALIHGGTARAERDATLAAFQRGEIIVLVNVYVLTEGFDAPATEVCMLARGCGSIATYLQMIGRVRRTATGKTRALLIDLMGCVHQHGMPDDDREFSLDGKPIRTKETPTAIRQCPQCAAAFRPTPLPILCPMCGYEFPPPEPPRVVTQALERVARGANASIEEQRAYWARVSRECIERGYKPGYAACKFRNHHGFWPPRSFPRVGQ